MAFGGGREDRRLADLLLAASEWLYGGLLSLYPRAFRRRYAEEMRRDFADLSREGLEEGGGTELLRVWGGAPRRRRSGTPTGGSAPASRWTPKASSPCA